MCQQFEVYVQYVECGTAFKPQMHLSCVKAIYSINQVTQEIRQQRKEAVNYTLHYCN